MLSVDCPWSSVFFLTSIRYVCPLFHSVDIALLWSCSSSICSLHSCWPCAMILNSITHICHLFSIWICVEWACWCWSCFCCCCCSTCFRKYRATYCRDRTCGDMVHIFVTLIVSFCSSVIWWDSRKNDSNGVFCCGSAWVLQIGKAKSLITHFTEF